MPLWKKLFIIAASLFSIFIAAPYLLLSTYVCSTSYLYELPNPAGLGDAIFYQEGGYNPDAPTIKLIVRDYQSSSGAVQNIDYIENPEHGVLLQDVVWSRDGSIIAVRSLGKSVPYVPPNPWTDKHELGKWQIAYDFQQHKKIEWDKVEAALRARGGTGQKALDKANFYQVARHTYLWEAFKYQ